MSWRDAKRLLCVRLDAMGDLLMSTPAIRALKEGPASPRITLLCSPAGAAIAPLIPEVDDVIVYEAPWMKASRPHESTRDLAMIERLRNEQFDGAVIFTVYSQNPWAAAVLCQLAGIPLRAAHSHENPYQLLTHWIKDPEPESGVRHEVQRHLDLVGAIGFHAEDETLSLEISNNAREQIAVLLDELDVHADRPLVVVHAGASAPSRRYPPEQFAESARLLYKEWGASLVFTGSVDEEPLIEEIRTQMGVPSHSVAGRLNLEELAALLERAAVLVANNTGPVHMAAAVGTPIVDLYALTNPQHTPWKVPNRVLFHDVPCKYCYKSICPEGHQSCLREVKPERVARAVGELLVCTR